MDIFFPSPKRKSVRDSKKEKKKPNVEHPKIKSHNPPAFSMDNLSKAFDYLDKEGYVVIQDVISDDQSKEGIDLFWKFMSELNTGIDRNDIETWNNKNWPNEFSTGIVSSYGVGQSEFMWFCRLQENVIKIFEKRLKTKDLLTSFDGLCVFRPVDRFNEWNTKSSWFHVDQSKKDSSHLCNQGLLNFYDVNEKTGGLAVYPKSHLLHAQYFKKYKDEGNARNFYIHPTENLGMFGEPVLICAPKNSMILWDSRTVHCNTRYLNKPKKGDDIVRLVSYICMMDKKLASKSVLDDRIKAVSRNATTSHWPILFQEKHSRFPRSKTLNPITRDVRFGLDLLSEKGKSLIGISVSDSDSEDE
jgi:ectoine hydroxylase-related dioxygenase (phytanoyl-CoA dioxygenase family)